MVKQRYLHAAKRSAGGAAADEATVYELAEKTLEEIGVPAIEAYITATMTRMPAGAARRGGAGGAGEAGGGTPGRGGAGPSQSQGGAGPSNARS